MVQHSQVFVSLLNSDLWLQANTPHHPPTHTHPQGHPVPELAPPVVVMAPPKLNLKS
jgi:hypothetical protein